MANITMPQLGFDMQEGTLVRWLVQPGDTVKRGDSVAEIETDKAVIEIECFENGVITELLIEPGTTVPVGEPIAIVDTGDGGAATTPAPKADKAEAPQPVDKPEEPKRKRPVEAPPTPAVPTAVPSAQAPELRVKASPLARRLAAEHGVDLHTLQGSGPAGRIVKADVLQAAEKAPATAAPTVAAIPAAEDEVVPLTRMRQTIARRLVESKQQTPHFYVTTSIDMGKAMDLRAELKQLDDVPPISVNDLVMKAAALALQKHPSLNSAFEGDAIRYFGAVHLSMAVAVEGGLITPVIRDCHAKSLAQIAVEARALAESARAGTLQPHEYQGGTFTISNLGMFGVEEFSAIINPPQAAILAVSAVIEQPVVRDGELTVGRMMRVTVSADHRATDGAQVALFLQDLKQILENPVRLLV